MKNISVLFCFLVIVTNTIEAQTEKNTAWMEYIEELAESEMNEDLIENLYEELSYLSDNPIDLNKVTKQDLEQYPFLSAIQIENLLYYLYKYGPMQSIYELKNIEGLDMKTIYYLLPFVYVEENFRVKEKLNPKQALKYGKHEMLIRSDYCFQEKAGYHNPTDERKKSNKAYLGERFYLSVKYGFSYKDKIQMGITGEKDAGEAFWNKRHKGFDFYSAHFALKEIGILKGLYLGDYKASFGQGLVLNTDFVTGKTSNVININKKSSGIKRHFSTNEIDFFRGIALSLEKENCNLDLFVSHKKADASISEDEITSFKTDGYNRTENDLEKKKQAELSLLGGNLFWRTEVFSLGGCFVFHDFGGKKLNPEVRDYNLFYLRKKNNFNAGISYAFQQKKYILQGETAISKNGSWATFNTFQCDPSSSVSFSLSYRNYQKDYQAFYGRAFGESSSVQNESGLYLGTIIRVIRNWEISTYMDFFRFPWLKYGTDMPSEGHDFFIQLNYRPTYDLTMNLRYRNKNKAKNKTSDQTPMASIGSYEQSKLRYQVNYQNKNRLRLRFQADYINYSNTSQIKTKGWMIGQNAAYTTSNQLFQIDSSIAYFNTDNWDTRIYVYEKNILYAFSSPAFYGEGLRAYSVLKINPIKNLSIQTKIAWSRYFDRNSISSGLEMIEGRDKTDINILIRFKF